MPLTKADFKDVDILDSYELKSDGRATTTPSVYRTTTAVSTTSGTNTIVSGLGPDGEGLLYSSDHPVEAGDFVRLVGSSGADGTYVVATIVDDTSVTVEGSIPTSTGGTLTWFYPSGASRVGFDPTGQTITTAANLQAALKDVANAVTGGGITEGQHQNLDTLVHEIDENSYDDVTRDVNDRVSNVTTWDSPAMLLKIREVQVTRNSLGRVTQLVTIQYDGFGAVKETLTETVSRTCSKVASITRVRT
jgi:hypothetical protein